MADTSGRQREVTPTLKAQHSLLVLHHGSVPEAGEDKNVATAGVVKVLLEVRQERAIPVQPDDIAVAVEVWRRSSVNVDPGSYRQES